MQIHKQAKTECGVYTEELMRWVWTGKQERKEDGVLWLVGKQDKVDESEMTRESVTSWHKAETSRNDKKVFKRK